MLHFILKFKTKDYGFISHFFNLIQTKGYRCSINLNRQAYAYIKFDQVEKSETDRLPFVVSDSSQNRVGHCRTNSKKSVGQCTTTLKTASDNVRQATKIETQGNAHTVGSQRKLRQFPLMLCRTKILSDNVGQATKKVSDIVRHQLIHY